MMSQKVLPANASAMKVVKPLREVVVKMKFHFESQAEYEAKRRAQKAENTSGADLERYQRQDRTGNVIYDPGEQIVSGSDVSMDNFRVDLLSAGFRLVDLVVFQGYGRGV